MNNVKIVIVEDEPLIAADLKIQLGKAGMEVLKVFESGEEVLDFLKKDQPDIILMDIHLFGSLDGIDTAHKINKHYEVPILFLTANTDIQTFSRAKLTLPHAFLSKPFRIKDILHAIELALNMEQDVKSDNLPQSHKYMDDRVFIRSHLHLEKVMYDQILYIEADRAYVKIVTEEKTFTLAQTLKKIENKIKVPYLLRVHRSFIINILNIDRISEGYVYMKKHKIPISRAHREVLYKTLNLL
jgi:DNA-binding LytR/AlgR family response regulator